MVERAPDNEKDRTVKLTGDNTILLSLFIAAVLLGG
jgi:hypothetical protein